MFYSGATAKQLLITGRKDGSVEFNLPSRQAAATHLVITTHVSSTLIAQLNQRLNRLLHEKRSLQEIRQIGYLLEQQVIPRGVREAMQSFGEEHVLLSLQGVAVPWELLCNQDSFWGCLYHLGRSLPLYSHRTEAVQNHSTQTTGNGSDRALLIANPSGDLLDAENEGQELLKMFRGYGLNCDYISRDQATIDEVLLRFSSGKYDFIHYCGHIVHDGKPALLLHNGQRLIAEEIRRCTLGGPVVFLNGCGGSISSHEIEMGTERGDLVDAFATAGARAIIGPLYPVADPDASSFAQAFYQAVMQSVTLGKALSAARREGLHHEGCAGWLAFVLYGDPALCFLPEVLAPLVEVDYVSRLDAGLLALLADAARLAVGSQYLTTAHIFLAALRDEVLSEEIAASSGINQEIALELLLPFVEGFNSSGSKSSALLNGMQISPNTLKTLEQLSLLARFTSKQMTTLDFVQAVLAEPQASVTQLLELAHEIHDPKNNDNYPRRR